MQALLHLTDEGRNDQNEIQHEQQFDLHAKLQ